MLIEMLRPYSEVLSSFDVFEQSREPTDEAQMVERILYFAVVAAYALFAFLVISA